MVYFIVEVWVKKKKRFFVDYSKYWKFYGVVYDYNLFFFNDLLKI